MPGHVSLWSRIGLGVGIIGMVMCTDAEVTHAPDVEAGRLQEPDSDDVSLGGSATEIRYHLTWDWGAAEPTDGGWRVITDRGYEVEVTEGYLVTYSVQLAPCTEEELGARLKLPRLLGAGRAWAGHGGAEDPSAWLTGIAEPLATPQSVSLEPVALDAGLYCNAHYLVARAEGKTRGLPDAFNMVGTSLYIQGTAALDGGEPQPFSIWSTLPVGELVVWSDPVSPVDLSDGTIDVTFTRDLGRLFDGVAFQTMNDESIEKTVLLGLIERLSVTLGAP
ncbi:MAG: hypothetical protein ACPGU1_11615 [Myxococcota bacterium]